MIDLTMQSVGGVFRTHHIGFNIPDSENISFLSAYRRVVTCLRGGEGGCPVVSFDMLVVLQLNSTSGHCEHEDETYSEGKGLLAKVYDFDGTVLQQKYVLLPRRDQSRQYQIEMQHPGGDCSLKVTVNYANAVKLL